MLILPTMTKKYSDASNFKEKFIKNYQSIKVNQLHSLYLIKKYTSEKRKQQGFLEQIEKEEPIDEKLLNYEANQIWDQLQKDQYFKKFSLVDKIDRGDLINIQEVDIVIQALIIKKLTVFDFYLTFVEYYHNSQIRKQLELGRACNIESLMQDLFNFSQSLALEMTMKYPTKTFTREIALPLYKEQTDFCYQSIFSTQNHKVYKFFNFPILIFIKYNCLRLNISQKGNLI